MKTNQQTKSKKKSYQDHGNDLFKFSPSDKREELRISYSLNMCEHFQILATLSQIIILIHLDRLHNASPQKAPITYLLNTYMLITGRGPETGQRHFVLLMLFSIMQREVHTHKKFIHCKWQCVIMNIITNLEGILTVSRLE